MILFEDVLDRPVRLPGTIWYCGAAHAGQRDRGPPRRVVTLVNVLQSQEQSRRWLLPGGCVSRSVG